MDGKLWQAKEKKDLPVKESDEVKLLKNNRTGRVEKTNTNLINLLLNHDYAPVICPPSLSCDRL